VQTSLIKLAKSLHHFGLEINSTFVAMVAETQLNGSSGFFSEVVRARSPGSSNSHGGTKIALVVIFGNGRKRGLTNNDPCVRIFYTL